MTIEYDAKAYSHTIEFLSRMLEEKKITRSGYQDDLDIAESTIYDLQNGIDVLNKEIKDLTIVLKDLYGGNFR